LAASGFTLHGGGGSGGGGAGGLTPGNASGVGTNNAGGGGGAVSGGEQAQRGGSGVVILRYLDTNGNATATTGSPTLTIAGGFRIYRFTGSGSITF
jgi:hypothetical protein